MNPSRREERDQAEQERKVNQELHEIERGLRLAMVACRRSEPEAPGRRDLLQRHGTIVAQQLERSDESVTALRALKRVAHPNTFPRLDRMLARQREVLELYRGFLAELVQLGYTPEEADDDDA